MINIPWIKPANKSKFILNYFLKKTNHLQDVKVQPQLRNRLKGKSLKYFKRQLRKMELVSRKRGSEYEYLLWMVALHVTSKSYEIKLKTIKTKILEHFWESI